MHSADWNVQLGHDLLHCKLMECVCKGENGSLTEVHNIGCDECRDQTTQGQVVIEGINGKRSPQNSM